MKMADPSPQLLIGMPLDATSLRKVGVLKYVPSAGSIPAPCDRCAQPTWIGPKQRERKRAQPETEFICANCLVADVIAARAAGWPVDVDVQSAGGNSGSYFMADGTAILPKSPKQN